MKSIELLAIGIRLFGIYVLILSFNSAIYAFNSYQQFIIVSQADTSVFIYVSTAQVITLLAASLLMLKFPVLLSRLLLPKTSEGEALFQGNRQDLQTTLFCILGVYILSRSIPDFFNNAIWWWYSKNNDLFQEGNSDRYLINEITTALEISIGLYLCLQSNGLSRLIYRLRTAGTKSP